MNILAQFYCTLDFPIPLDHRRLLILAKHLLHHANNFAERGVGMDTFNDLRPYLTNIVQTLPDGGNLSIQMEVFPKKWAIFNFKHENRNFQLLTFQYSGLELH
jgi:hypothetical protein